MNRRLCILSLVLVFAPDALLPDAGADVIRFSTCTIGVVSDGFPFPPGKPAANCALNAANLWGTASATSEFGLLQAGVDAGWMSLSSSSSRPNATAFWADELLLTAPGLQGTGYVLTHGFFIEGFLDATGNGIAQALLTVPENIPATLAFSATATTGDNVVSFVGSVELHGTFGVPLQLTQRLELRGGANSFLPSSGSALSNFLSTAGWGGILSVEAAGQPVTNYSVSSASGTDYRFSFQRPPIPAPEPATLLLLTTGIALVLRGRGDGRSYRTHPKRPHRVF
jgi:hypothetical protein